MKNERYTVFVTKTNELDEVCLVDTLNENKYLQAIEWAKSNGYKITRTYLPNTEITLDLRFDFTKSIKP
jgi:hypothetical protein